MSQKFSKIAIINCPMYLYNTSFLYLWLHILATHSSNLAWRIPWTEEPGGLQSIGLHRVRHDWSDLAGTHSSSTSSHMKDFLVSFCERQMVLWIECLCALLPNSDVEIWSSWSWYLEVGLLGGNWVRSTEPSTLRQDQPQDYQQEDYHSLKAQMMVSIFQ